MPTRLWEMGVGCLLFLTHQHIYNYDRFVEKFSPSLIIAAITITLFIPLKFAVQATIAVVALTALLIACLRPETLLYKAFSYPKIVYVGLISYSLYLWHWGVLSISRWTIGIHWWTLPFQIGLIFLLSILTYQYVETPLRQLDWSKVRWKTLVYGVAALSSTSVVLWSLTRAPDLFLYLGRPPSMIATGVSSLTDTYSLDVSNPSWQGQKCILSHNSEVGKEISIKDCTLGDFSSANQRVLVFGNSFSAAFVQAFENLVSKDNYSITLTSSWGASPVPEVSNDTSWDKANDYYWNSVYPSLTRKLKSGDWVFLVSDLESFSPEVVTLEASERLAQLKVGLTELSEELASKGIKLAILHAIPFAREANCKPAIAAKQWFTPFGNHCQLPNRSDSLLRRTPLDKVLLSLENERKLRIIDVFDVFCPDEECTYNARDGQILYRDEFSHPSVEAARLTAPIIRRALTSPMEPKL